MADTTETPPAPATASAPAGAPAPKKVKKGKKPKRAAKKRSGGSVSLGTRIFLLMAFLVVLAVGAAVLLTYLQGGRIAGDEIDSALGRSVRSMETVQELYENKLVQESFNVVDPYFTAYVAESSGGLPAGPAGLTEAPSGASAVGLRDLLDEQRNKVGFNFAAVLDPSGQLVAHTDPRRMEEGEDLASRPLVSEAMRNAEVLVGVWPDQGGPEDTSLYHAVVIPLVGGSFERVGYLVTGFLMDDILVSDLAEISGTEVAILARTAQGGRVVAETSLDSRQQTQLVSSIVREGLDRQLDQPGTARLELDGEPWKAQIVPLTDAAGQPVGSILAMVSLDDKLAPFRSIQEALAIIGAVSVVLALILSYLLSRRTLGPVRRLVGMVEAARHGDYEQEVRVERADEVGQLARAFDHLMGELREKRDMQAYLVDLSRTLPEPGQGADIVVPSSERRVVLLALELRRYARLQAVKDPAATFERMNRDLRKVASAISGHRGNLEGILGHRLLASFEGENRALEALGAAAEAVTAVTAPENAFDEPAEAICALAGGRVASGSVTWADKALQAVVGPPVQKLEALMREAASGELNLTKDVFKDLEDALREAGVEIEPFRGVLSPIPLYSLSPDAAAKVSGVSLTRVDQAVVTQRAVALAELGPGRTLGMRFEILAELGAGGMGVVYKARDREIGDLVALKVLRRDLLDDLVHLARLKDELRLARKITHPNVLRTYDFGELEGIHYISMEYVRGVTLRYMLDQSERLPFSAGLRLAKQLCAGLAAAHAEGVIHRDIKPDNVILDQAGNARLMDFGIARKLDRDAPGVTQEGFTVGTPQFMAPEQLEGKPVDARVDIYATGVVLYEIFTGRLPFTGESPVQLALRQINERPPPPSQFWSEIPERLEWVILTCLAKQPEGRFSRIEEVSRELEALSV